MLVSEYLAPGIFVYNKSELKGIIDFLLARREIYCTYIHGGCHGNYQTGKLPCCTFLNTSYA